MLGSIHANQFFLGFYTQFGEDPDDTGTDQGADHSHCNGDADAGQLSQEQVYVAEDQAVPLGNRVDVAAGEQAGGDAAPDTADAVAAESIQSIVDFQLLLQQADAEEAPRG